MTTVCTGEVCNRRPSRNARSGPVHKSSSPPRLTSAAPSWRCLISKDTESMPHPPDVRRVFNHARDIATAPKRHSTATGALSTTFVNPDRDTSGLVVPKTRSVADLGVRCLGSRVAEDGVVSVVYELFCRTVELPV